MIRMISVEMLKLRGSLSLLVLIIAPLLVGGLAGLAVMAANQVMGWEDLFISLTFPLWALFLLPMTATLFTTLMAQIEHGPGAFDHLLALPISKAQLFFAKLVIAFIGVVIMGSLLVVFVWGCAQLGGLLSNRPIEGTFHFGSLLRASLVFSLCAAPLTLLQSWAALRFKSFIPPLGLGMAGVLVTIAIAMTNTDKADWFPHAQPFLALLRPDDALRPFVLLLLTLILIPICLYDLGRREMR